jgi:hypothetical protein
LLGTTAGELAPQSLEFASWRIPFLLTRLFLRKIASSNFGSQKSGIFALRERKGASERFIRGYLQYSKPSGENQPTEKWKKTAKSV